MLILAVLPWLTSGSRLGAAIADWAGGQAGLRLRIDSARWGWWQGLVLEGVRSDLGEGKGLWIERLAIETGPWDLLGRKTIRHIELAGATIDMALADESVPAARPAPGSQPARPEREKGDSSGRNGSIDRPAERSDSLTVLPPIRIDRISLADCTVRLRDPRTGQAVDLFLPAGAVDLDPQVGEAAWRLSMKVGRTGLVTTEGRFIFPGLALQPGEPGGGTLKLNWHDLPLAELPEGLVRRAGLATLAGQVSGSVDLQLRPERGGQDWTVQYDIAGSAQSLRVQPRKGRAVYLARGEGGVAGQWQLVADHVRLDKAWLDVPGGRVASVEPALIYDGRSRRVVQSNLVGEVADAKTFRAMLTDMGLHLPGELQLAGRCGLDVRVARQREATVVRLAVAGDGLAVDWPGQYHQQAGEPLSIAATCRIGDDGSLAAEPVRIDVPGGHVRIDAELGTQVGGPGPLVTFGRSEVQLHWDDFETFIGQVPAAARLVAGHARVSGPGSLKVAAAPEGEGYRTTLSLAMPAGSRVSLADWLEKPAGQDLRLEVATRVSRQYDWLALDEVRVQAAERTLLDLRDVKIAAGPLRRAGQDHSLLVELGARLVRLDVSAVRALSPRIGQALAQAGQAEGIVRGQGSVTCWADGRASSLQVQGLTAAGELDLDDLAVSLEGTLRKETGERLRLAGGMQCQWAEQGPYGYGGATIESPGFALQAWYENDPASPGDRQYSWGWLRVQDIDATARMLPGLEKVVHRDDIAGHLAADWQWQRHGDTFDLRFGFDLTGIACSPAALDIRKPAGLPAKLEVAVSGPAGSAAGQEVRHWRLPKVHFVLGQSQAGITDAEVEMSEPWAKLLAGQGREALGLISFTWPVRHARGKASGTTVFGEVLASVSPEIGTLLAKYRAAGPVGWTLDWQYEHDKGVEFAAKADAAQLALHAGGLDKPAGVALQADVRGKAAVRRQGEQPVLSVDLATVAGQAASLSWSGQVQAEARLGKAPRLLRGRVSGKFDSREVEQLAALFEPARPWQLQGHLAAEGAAAFDGTAWRVEDLDVGLWPIEWSLEGTPCRLMGLVNLQDRTLATTGLGLSLGRTRGKATVHATLAEQALLGQVGLVFSRLDIDEIGGLVDRLGKTNPAEAGAAATATAPAAPGRPLVDLSCSRLEFVGLAENLRAKLDNGPPATLSLVGWQGRLHDGAVAVDFHGAFEGGALSADIRGHVIDRNVPLKIHYHIDQANPTPLTKRMVERSFPGLRVDGVVTWDEALTIDLTRPFTAMTIPNTGEMIVEGGEVSGAAAPKSVARIFPGLQLAKFRFDRLHNWFQRDAEGTTVNRMIFKGSPWSLYMNGWSRLDGKLRYEIGVDLLGSIESEYWATADRGRVPLFIKTGQVVNGKISDEVVSFLNPKQIGERIFKDNLVTILYHAVRQQILRGRTAAPPPVPVLATQPAGQASANR